MGHHEGNKIYRVLVWSAQKKYKSLNEYTQKKEKRDVSRAIVLGLQQQGCRFLQKEAGSNMWFIVPDKCALDKVSQALRDPTPEEKREKKNIDREKGRTRENKENQSHHQLFAITKAS